MTGSSTRTSSSTSSSPSTTDKAEAFTDASFIFAQMRVGGYAMREQDEKIPLRHGCVGQETCGCGGLAYGMRTIFPMVELIDDVEKYAKPDYWILNYSNPAAIVSEACRVLRPKARIINICDMPIAIIDVVAAALGVKKQDIVYDYFGLNHFGWFTSIEVNGEEVLPKLREYIHEHEIFMPEAFLKDKGALIKPNKSKRRRTARRASRTATSRAAGITCGRASTRSWSSSRVLPNTYLNYYLQQKEFVSTPTPSARAPTRWRRRARRTSSTASTATRQPARLTRACSMQAATATGSRTWPSHSRTTRRRASSSSPKTAGRSPTCPTMPWLRWPAYIGKKGPEVIAQDPIPLFQQGLMMQQLNSEKLLVEGAIEGSYEKVLKAFTLNKTVPSMTVAKEVLDDMIEANKGYWPELK